MNDLRATPAEWGLFGGLLFGLCGLVTLFQEGRYAEARRQAWLKLPFGLVAGPIAAEALIAGVVFKVAPSVDMRALTACAR